jgi:ACS family D-galactonate transporter-like MFS transporter
MTNSISSLVLGYQVDNFNRKYLLVGSCLVWNVICALSYFIDSFAMMVLIRMSFAVISSVHTPGCISLIGDYFEHENRSKANSVYVAAISFGMGLANLTSLINNSIGWRECSLVVSGIGIVFSLVALSLYEPARTDDRGN